MLIPIYATLAIAFVFYLVLPLISALYEASIWRRFRSRLFALTKAPKVSYRDVAVGARGPGLAGPFRFYGQVEAMEGSDRLWVRGEGLSMAIDLSRSPLYVLEPAEGGPSSETAKQASLERLSWRRVHSLSEGTKLFVGGRISFSEGRPLFVETPGDALVALAYDGEADDLFPRVLSGARRKNRLSARMTLLFWALGLSVLSLYFLGFSDSTILGSVRFVAYLIAFSPLLPLVPPGMAFFFLSRRLWLLSVEAGVDMDIVAMDSAKAGSAPTERGRKKFLVFRFLSALSMGLALSLNFVLSFVIFRYLDK